MDVANQAVENLVTQFSSALDFYRELVQNSIDAGSAAIDIWLDFVPDEDGGAGGVIEIHVDDHGEGMNEEIIDEQLTTLFSSSKENDQTKIGKFGIGFVSVFAPKPRAVLVQTGRGGEYWEVLFDQDRSFTKAPLSTPVEGTQITLFLEGDRARYTELVARSLETVDHWCRHSEAEITFEDRASLDGVSVQINKPFAVEGECATAFERDGTEIVLAYSRTPVWGFYNKGLALAVVRGQSDLVPGALAHVAFRIKSRYLEHTLSRETVMRDENYEKAMLMVREAAGGPLLRGLIEAIAQLVALPRRWTASERGRYFELMGYLARESAEALLPYMQVPLLLGHDGRGVALEQLCKQAAADGRVFVEHEPTRLVEQLIEQGTPVIVIPNSSELGGQLGPVTRVIANGLSLEFAKLGALGKVIKEVRGLWARTGELISRPVDVLVGVDVDDRPQPQALIKHAAVLLERGFGPEPGLVGRALKFLRREQLGLGYARLVSARLHGAPGQRLPLFVVAHAIAPLMAIPTPDRFVSARTERPEVAVNCEHPHFRTLLRLAEHEPELAAYCLAKSLLLDDERALEYDGKLMLAAVGPDEPGWRSY